jgi:hypothetical protein
MAFAQAASGESARRETFENETILDLRERDFLSFGRRP